MTNQQHLPLATNSPPNEVIENAKKLALSQSGPVYLYQYTQGWGFTEKLAKVPSGALITLIHGNRHAPEVWNTGGC
jgi:hypothetical protein